MHRKLLYLFALSALGGAAGCRGRPDAALIQFAGCLTRTKGAPRWESPSRSHQRQSSQDADLPDHSMLDV